MQCNKDDHIHNTPCREEWTGFEKLFEEPEISTSGIDTGYNTNIEPRRGFGAI